MEKYTGIIHVSKIFQSHTIPSQLVQYRTITYIPIPEYITIRTLRNTILPGIDLLVMQVVGY